MSRTASVTRQTLAAVLLAYCIGLSVFVPLERGGIMGPVVLLVGWSPICLGGAFLVLLDHPKTPRMPARCGLESSLTRWAAMALIAVHWVALPLVVPVAASAYRGRSERSGALRRCVSALIGSVAAIVCLAYADRPSPAPSLLDYALVGHAVLWLWLSRCEYREFSAFPRTDEAVVHDHVGTEHSQ